MIGTIVEVHNQSSQEPDNPSGRGREPLRLTLRLEGEGPVKEGLSQAVAATRQAVKQIGRVLLSGLPDSQGGPDRRADRECELFIVSWNEAEALAVLEPPPPQAQLNLFSDIGEESVACFLDGLEEIAGQGLDPTRMPPGFDQAVLQSCLALSELLNAGFSSLVFKIPARRTVLNRACRDRLCQYLITPPRLERWSLIGRLEALSGRGRLTGMVWDDCGTRWICRFKSEHLAHLPAAWMRCVELTGRAVLEPNQDRILEVESIVVPESGPDPGGAEPSSADRLRFGRDESEDLLRMLEDGPEEILKNVLLD